MLFLLFFWSKEPFRIVIHYLISIKLISNHLLINICSSFTISILLRINLIFFIIFIWYLTYFFVFLPVLCIQLFSKIIIKTLGLFMSDVSFYCYQVDFRQKICLVYMWMDVRNCWIILKENFLGFYLFIIE